VLDDVDRNQRKRGLASASLKSGSMAASGTFQTWPWYCAMSVHGGKADLAIARPDFRV
jgi:hypothetical protein